MSICFIRFYSREMGPMKKNHRNFFTIMTLLLVIVGGMVLLYQFRNELHLSILLPKKSDLTKPLKGTMRCTMISTVEEAHYLRMQLAIPYKDRKQWMEIKKALPSIKNEFILVMNEEGMELILRERDFETLRRLLLRTFNRHLKKPVDNIYFESFFYD